MSLVGLIHDAGKVLALFGQPQFATVGDTFPVGCAMAEAHTFSRFYPLNPDSSDPRYNTKHGMYQPRCGLDNVMMSYGHDGV
jgi:inositol oxygenase